MIRPYDPAAVGTRLRRGRTAQNISQRELSEAVGVSAAYISQIESGNRLPSEHVIGLLARQLELDPLQLLTGRRRRVCPLCGTNTHSNGKG
jgi:transcriptional regulator with XRE-family HTH domain